MKNRRNILILDPERDTAELFSRALENHRDGYKCYWVDNVQQAGSLLCEIPFSFLLADVETLQDDHFLLLDTIKVANTATIVITSGYIKDKRSIKAALERGADAYFIKPVMVGTLRKLIDDFSALCA